MYLAVMGQAVNMLSPATVALMETNNLICILAQHASHECRHIGMASHVQHRNAARFFLPVWRCVWPWIRLHSVDRAITKHTGRMVYNEHVSIKSSSQH